MWRLWRTGTYILAKTAAALIPAYTGWPRKSKVEDRKSKIGEGEGGVHHRDAEREEGGGEKSSEEAA